MNIACGSVKHGWPFTVVATVLVAITAFSIAASGAAAFPQLASASLAGSAAGCLAEKQTLTSSCGGMCDEYDACLAYDVSTMDNDSCTDCVVGDDGVCAYQCLDTAYELPDGTSAYMFLVTYGSYVSDREVVERTSNPDFDAQVEAQQNDAALIAHASNDEVTAIGTLDIPILATSM